MNPSTSSSLILLGMAALVLVALLGPGASPAQAASTSFTGDHVTAPTIAMFAASIEGLKNWFMAHVINAFSFRERMIQMLAVGLFIGLFVMLRKMPGQT